jgi:hypothetical protein
MTYEPSENWGYRGGEWYIVKIMYWGTYKGMQPPPSKPPVTSCGGVDFEVHDTHGNLIESGYTKDSPINVKSRHDLGVPVGAWGVWKPRASGCNDLTYAYWRKKYKAFCCGCNFKYWMICFPKHQLWLKVTWHPPNNGPERNWFSYKTYGYV